MIPTLVLSERPQAHTTDAFDSAGWWGVGVAAVFAVDDTGWWFWRYREGVPFFGVSAVVLVGLAGLIGVLIAKRPRPDSSEPVSPPDL